MAEYNKKHMGAKCAKAENLQFSLTFKNRNLDAWRRACP